MPHVQISEPDLTIVRAAAQRAQCDGHTGDGEALADLARRFADSLPACEGAKPPSPTSPTHGMPWSRPELDGWSIVGMNHYHVAGQRHLFVSMANSGRCITSEGTDEASIWDSLARSALAFARS